MATGCAATTWRVRGCTQESACGVGAGYCAADYSAAARGAASHRHKPVFLIWIASATHVALYGFIFAMPVVGAIAWFGLIEDAGDIHATASKILLALIGLHDAGALAEHFVFRNDTLKRMFIPAKRSSS
jgi:cytochrome b561